jgi:tetratricopeptide (TPR) repeat protein
MTERNNPTKHDTATTAPDALAARLIGGEINLAEYVGLKREQLYAIAQVGYQFYLSGKIEEARDIYRGLVAADPFDSVFHCHLAAAYHRLGELDKAFDEYTESLRFNVANQEALAGRGEIHLQRASIPEALSDLRAAIELDPESKRATTLRARAVLFAVKEALKREGQ